MAAICSGSVEIVLEPAWGKGGEEDLDSAETNDSFCLACGPEGLVDCPLPGNPPFPPPDPEPLSHPKPSAAGAQAAARAAPSRTFSASMKGASPAAAAVDRPAEAGGAAVLLTAATKTEVLTICSSAEGAVIKSSGFESWVSCCF